jgi:hypothetical protein
VFKDQLNVFKKAYRAKDDSKMLNGAEVVLILGLNCLFPTCHFASEKNNKFTENNFFFFIHTVVSGKQMNRLLLSVPLCLFFIALRGVHQKVE